jgi:AcrR family transcriptional regulator
VICNSRVERKKKETRQTILEICEEIFLAEKSFDRVTMREIARKADVSVGALYLHFRTKEDILANLTARFIVRHIGLITDFISGTTEGAARLHKLLEYFRQMTADPILSIFPTMPLCTFNKFNTIDAATLDAVLGAFDKLISLTESIFSAGRDDGTLQFDDNPKILAETLIRSVMALFQEYYTPDSDLFFRLNTHRIYNFSDIFSVFSTVFLKGVLIKK